MTTSQKLQLRGLRQNNLKSLDIDLPHDKLVAITGVSGSGKSTLAFDTIYAEGGRRYIETFSPYTRQFLDRLERPQLDSIQGVRPALALEQRNTTNNSRSTVGTVTEINDYLKLIWSQLAELTCPGCSASVKRSTPQVIADQLADLFPKQSKASLLIAFPVVWRGTASLESLAATLESEGFVRFYNEQTNAVERLEQLRDHRPAEDRLLVVVDRLHFDSFPLSKQQRERLIASLNQAYAFGHDYLQLIIESKNGKTRFIRRSRKFICADCDQEYPEPRPSLFTFNSAIGACGECQGFGKVLRFDPDLCLPDHSLSIDDGAVACWTTSARSAERRSLLRFCSEQGISTTTPWAKLSKRERDQIFEGTKDYRGILGWFRRLERKKYKMHVRVLLSRYRSEVECPTCLGTRLKPEALLFRLNSLTLPDFWGLSLERAYGFLQNLSSSYRHDEFSEAALGEVLARIGYLIDIGLGYLTLNRQSRTLSGGEHQRVNLTSILGSRLVNTMLVLDEPTIGLHPRDTARLITSMEALRDRGNSVYVVEHDQDVIRAADEVVDLGPDSGSHGGQIVYQGPLSGLAKEAHSKTGQSLQSSREVTEPRRTLSKQHALTIKNAAAHNLKHIDVSIPLGGLVVVTGVSGSGKSSLVQDSLFAAYEKLRQGSTPSALKRSAQIPVDGLAGLAKIDEILLIDQSPVGKSPRSNPATYTKAWDGIRECFAEADRAQQLGLTKSSFSFNVEGGRCPACNGAGYDKIEMQFLADVYVKCDICGGTRFQESVLDVRFAGKNVIEMLDTTLSDALGLFVSLDQDKKVADVIRRLQPLIDLGLGYLRLGQPLSKLSGGEAQRVKLAAHLLEYQKKSCLFILDEPTTGLHPHNVQDLLKTFDQLIQHGHSVLVVEHNLDVIRNADWIVDLGPEAGENGGELVAEGSPYDLVQKKHTKSNSRSATRELLRNAPSASLPSAHPIRARKTSLASSTPREDAIIVSGARHHNLRNISLSVPKGKLVAITGVSGSGKSSLAFDIIFAEGQRRYIDCLSPYARQYIKQLSRPDVDRVDSIPPTVAVSQKTAPPLGVSTIATTTELYQYLRLLYSKVGVQHCPEDGTQITSRSPDSISETILQRWSQERIYLFAPVVEGRKGIYNDLFQRAHRAEISEARIDGNVRSISPDLRLERNKLHWISLLVASLSAKSMTRQMLEAAVEQALLLGNGGVEVAVGDKNAAPELLSISRVCPTCQRGYRELDPQDFSFRSSRGICGHCDGRGTVGDGERRPIVTCSVCDGARIGPIGRAVLLGDKTIAELHRMRAPELLHFFGTTSFPKRLEPILYPILSELTHRLRILCEVGLDYLNLDRDSSSISGGEAQRLRLARTLGSPLSGVCYVLDEPTIGLHSADHQRLMTILKQLRDSGNSLLVVEHDEDTILQADHVIDIGPAGGAQGGQVVFEGSVAALLESEISTTGRALRERQGSSLRSSDLSSHQWLSIRGASAHNLKAVDAAFPLGAISVVCGVSGAGKSSLVHHCLVPALIANFEESKRSKHAPVWPWRALEGADTLERYIEIDQTPVGKTSTSTPASYLGIFNDIRSLYASLPEAEVRGYDAKHFSFNTGAGRCDNCEGRGFTKIPMNFLPDATIECDICNGMRYNESTLDVLYQGLSIGELLRKTMSEARDILRNHKRIRRALDYIHDLGLGYLTLGQPTHTLSGGEAQRLKIARELGSREAVDTLYVLDEPTTGLHMVDVDKLFAVLEKLVERGNSIIIIEHNLDIIAQAHYLIELGPVAGDAGGQIIFCGSPAQLASHPTPTPTQPFLQARSAKSVIELQRGQLRSRRATKGNTNRDNAVDPCTPGNDGSCATAVDGISNI